MTKPSTPPPTATSSLPTSPGLAPEVSIVMPAYNEADNLRVAIQALSGLLNGCTRSFEIVIVNDGSRDRTRATLAELAVEFTCIRHIDLSRNFGKEAAMSAGLENAHGECLIFIDADLQHPPELIPDMLAAWRAGSDVVNAVKRDRGDESIFYRALAGSFNWIMSSSIGTDVSGASDYKLIDRQVADALIACTERSRFFRGLVAWVGFETVNLPFDVQERNAGETKWSPLSLIKYSIRNVLTFSSLPLLGVAYSGFLVIFLGILLVVQTLYNYLSGHSLSGFTTVIVTQVLLSGMILFALGIIAIYLARMYEEQKSRPMFLIRHPRKKDEPK